MKHSLMTMLRYKRPEGSVTQEAFCKTFLEPSMGEPDEFGNYIHIIHNSDGSQPSVAFMAHHDTVHVTEGLQTVVTDSGLVYSMSGECLGADCTTGCWLILEMIDNSIPGVYIIHSGEEIGCIGSGLLVKSKPEWLQDIKSAISFDRKGKTSVITHQMGRRTCSEDFANSLVGILNGDSEDMAYEKDPTGSYTDSNEYIEDVAECTNISVGYYSQHTRKECQDIQYAYLLRDQLIAADWSQLVIQRDPLTKEYDDDAYGWGYPAGGYTFGYKPGSYSNSKTTGTTYDDKYDMETLVRNFPDLIADLLLSWGLRSDDIADDLEEFGQDDTDFIRYRMG